MKNPSLIRIQELMNDEERIKHLMQLKAKLEAQLELVMKELRKLVSK